MFAGRDKDGRAWGRIASLIETAKANGVKTFADLRAMLEALAAGHPYNRIDDLLPWNFKPSSWKHGGNEPPLTVYQQNLQDKYEAQSCRKRKYCESGFVLVRDLAGSP